ncbi:hypothetical protein NDU88_012686 [Pleurodeles waltl]|uniref:Uncharacterized protein n=1 Tax=Pleurodeles waltl TaxID=8319 RepID=A0AAV7R2M4_PLEWA|nr:hypothetical protein NDU88_012686 [Pleurodeles waltl]
MWGGCHCRPPPSRRGCALCPAGAAPPGPRDPEAVAGREGSLPAAAGLALGGAAGEAAAVGALGLGGQPEPGCEPPPAAPERGRCGGDRPRKIY